MTITDFIRKIETQFLYPPTRGQEELIVSLAGFIFSRREKGVYVLKGYAGTGKTTIISAFVNQLILLQKKSVLLAPTGRAAKVFSAYSGFKAYTIHKKIYMITSGSDGTVNLMLSANKHRNTIFFVDEASMIPAGKMIQAHLFSDRHLLEDLINYVFSGDQCQLVLIGDTAQLPPVGSDISPALDLQYLTKSFDCDVVSYELQDVVRQTLESGILANATTIRHHLFTPGLQRLINTREFKDIKSITGELLEEYLNSAFSSNNHYMATIITRSNKRANIFNQEIRKRILFREGEISTGDLLMAVKNNYFWLKEDSGAGFIANGDLIEILRITRYEESYGYHFADVTIRLLDYPDEKDLTVKILLDTLMLDAPSLTAQQSKDFFDKVMDDHADIPSHRKRLESVRKNPFFNAIQVKFAYALTCHKTQGGQWEKVFIDLGYLKDDQIDSSFYRWLYTAFTRATRELFLINFPEKLFLKN
ncbi:MAG: ATP-dependent DNA helicase [Bacteroidales bacterium]